MAYASAESGGYGVDSSVIHIDPAHPDQIRVPDAELLFRGEYQRLGPDLVLIGPDGHHHIIPGYFSSEAHPALVAPNGAALAPDVIDLLAGSPTPGQYAQAQPTTPPDAIGKVEKVIGSVTVVRNGVAVALHVGDAVYKSDVVQTGANSSVGVGFPDGTALNLVANTRMALNDYSFDASGTSNSALFTLVEGTFAFVAGKVAHDGNMKVATPVATMGIRGTTVYFATVTSSLGEVQYLAQLFADYQTGHVGAVEWFDNNPASPTYGQLIDSITDTGYAHYFTPRLDMAPSVAVQLASTVQLDQQMQIINDLFRVIQLNNAGNQSTTPSSGSSTLPDIDVPHVIEPNGGNNTGPFTFNFSVPGLTNPIVLALFVLPTAPQLPTSQTHQTQSNTTPLSGPIVWNPNAAGADWNHGPNWTGGNVPGPTNDVQILVPVTVNIADTEAAKSLLVGAGAELLITGDGALTLANGLDDFGIVQVGGGDPPMLTVNGPVTVEALALLEAFGDGTQIQLSKITLSNLGTIEAGEQATITISLNAESTNSGLIEAFDGGVITLNGNGHSFTNQFLIEASGEGAQIQISNIALSNTGTIDAEALATITIGFSGDGSNTGTIDGFNGGVITINENGHGFTNHGFIEAFDGGGIAIVGGLTNAAGAIVEAVGPNALIDLSNGTIENQSGASIYASDRGSITLDAEILTNDSGARIEAKDLGTITFDGGGLTNDAKVEAKDYGSIAFNSITDNPISVTNDAGAEFLAKDHGSIAFSGVGLLNNADAIVLAKDYGSITFTQSEDGPGGITNAGLIEAKDHGTITFQDIGGDNTGGITNTNGTIAAVGLGAVVNFEHSSIIGGTLNADGGAILVSADSTLTGPVNVGIGGGGFADFANVVDANDAAVSVAFTGMGTLELDQAPAAPITVTGFGIGDAFDLTNIQFNGCQTATASWTDNTLTVTNGQQTENFTVEGSGSVTAVQDASGGTEVFFGNDVWINTAGGNWNDGESWSGDVPSSETDAVIGVSGTYTVTLTSDDESNRANSLAITDAGATLTGTGTLTIATTLDNAGTIDATGCDVLYVNADTLINEYSGVIAALNGGNLALTDQTDSSNYGMIKAAGDGSTITINVALSEDASGGNFGKMEAVAGGSFVVVGDVSNAAGATIKALGGGSQFTFSANDEFDGDNVVTNEGSILAKDHGKVAFDGVEVFNYNPLTDENPGTIEAEDRGIICFDGATIYNENGGAITALGWGSEVRIENSTITNDGQSILDALGWGSKLSIEGSSITDGALTADGGTIFIGGGSTVTNGTLTADGGTVSIGGGSTLINGTLTADGGTVFVGGDSTLTNVAIVITDRGIAEFCGPLFQGITFSGDGTLKLDQAPDEGAVVTNFAANGANDVLDFTNIAWADAPTPSWVENEQHTAGTLTITYEVNNGCMTESQSESITLDGNYAPNAFTVLSDPSGGTDVVYGVQQTWAGGTSDQWNAASNWSNGVVPGTTDTAIIDNAGHQPVSITDTEQVANLVIGSGASLELDSGGLLTVTNALDDSGLIDVNATGSDPFLLIDGPVRVEGDAEIIAEGSGATAEFFDDQVGNAGNISALSQGSVLFEGSAVSNQDGGVIKATTLSDVTFDNATVDNHGGATIEADGGQVLFEHSTITNDDDDSPALIEASGGGTVSFIDSTVTGSDGTIQADAESVVKVAGSTIDGGEISGDGTFEVAGSSTLKGCADVSVAQINVEDGVTLTADHISIDGSTINLGHAATGNAAAFTEISVPDVNAIGPAISADGEFVAFITSTNLPGQGQGDTENVAVELYDAVTGKLTDISAAAPALPTGDIAQGFSNVPSISADGRYVVFDEKYEVPNNQGPAMETSEVLLYDRQSQSVTVVQTFAGHAEISGDGQYIAMQADTIPGNENSFGESVLVTDRSGNVLTTISGDPHSENGSGNSVNEPAISGDGRFVTFWTTASEIEINNNLVQTNNGTGNAEVYLYDRENGTLQMVSAVGGTPGDGNSGTMGSGDQHNDSWPSSLSADGHYVVFQSTADDLFAGVGDAAHDVSNIFLYDTQTGTITAITDADSLSSPSAVGSIRPEISADGTTVTFASDESDLPGANGIAQTYSYDTQTQAIELVSTPDGTTPANAESDLASAVSTNGAAIAFGSLADNLVPTTANDGNANIYLAAPGTVDITGDSTIGGGATINDGTAIVENGVTLTVGDATLNGTFVQVGAGATLQVEGTDPIATFNGVEVSNEGTIQVDDAEQSATLIGTDGMTITGGTLSIGASGLVESEAGSNAVGLVLDDVTVWNCGTLEADGATFTVADATTITGGTISINASDGGELVVDSTAGATFSNVNLVGLVGSSTGMVQVGQVFSSTLSLTAGTIMSNIDLTIESGSKVEIDGIGKALGAEFDSVNVTNNGEMEVNGATFFADSNSTFSGSGYLAITGGGLANFACEFDQNVTFQGAGTLELQQSLSNGDYSGVVTGFGAGDTIDLNDLAYTSGEYAVWTQATTGGDAAGTLQIYCGNGTLEETLNLNGTYTQNEFALADDNTASHGTDVTNYISFFNGQTNFSDNLDVGYTGPQISPDGSAITLTNNLLGEYGSWFDHSTHSITAFTTSFDYQATGQADGMAFILQNDPRGAGALGTDFAESGGSGLGYDGISHSAAIEFNFYGTDPPHVPGTNFETNGTTGIYNPTGDVTLGNGDNIQVVLSYDGCILTETLTDLTNGATYSTSYTDIGLSEIVGADTAYVGFSAATGGLSSTQIVSDFNFESGQAVHWVGESGQNWTDAGVWTDGNEHTVGTPNAASNVFINEEGAYTLTITTADTANLLTITSDGAGADVQDETGGSLTLNGSLTIDAGSFSLIGGALSAASIYVGASGHFIGYGNVAAPLDNDGGFVEAQQNLSLLAPVTGDGCFQIDNDAVLEFGGSVAGGTVMFGSENGTLKLDDPSGFNGMIAAKCGMLSPGDILDLGGLGSQVGDLFDYSTSFNGTVTTLTVTDTSVGNSASVYLLGDYTTSEWNVAADGNGGANVYDPPATNTSANPSVSSTATASGASGTVTFSDNDADTLTASVTPKGSDYVGTFTLDPLTQGNGDASLGFHFDLGSDQINLAPGQTLTQSYGINVSDAQNPAMNVHQTVAVSIGGAGNDNFVFHPGVGADTIIGFNPTNDTIELDHFANAHTMQQLESLITSDAQGDAVIALGNHDSITVAGVTATHLQQLAQSGHVIMH